MKGAPAGMIRVCIHFFQIARCDSPDPFPPLTAGVDSHTGLIK